MRRRMGKKRWWFKAKGPRKIRTVAPYSKNACK
jgi:hypothetical protein